MRGLFYLASAVFLGAACGLAVAQTGQPAEVPTSIPPSVPLLQQPPHGAEPLGTRQLDLSRDAAPVTAEAPGEDDAGPAVGAQEAEVAGAQLVLSGSGTEDAATVFRSPQPYNVTNGSFVYNVGLDLPPFHGIEPRLSLQYSSSRKLTGGAASQGWLGVGWVLDGLQVVERATARRGTPHYDENDIFLLNGQELLACDLSSASPSCATGGTHFSKVESYARFSFNATANTWTITDRAGNHSVLEAVGHFMSGSASNDVDEKHRNQYRWLLSELADTHGNTVTFDYDCAVAPQCELAQIFYTGTVVDLFWEARPDVVSYGTGVGVGKATKRLKTVRVSHGGSAQKAFALVYEQQHVTGQSLLDEVVPIGSDVVLDGVGAVTSGSELPKYTFQYTSTNSGFTWSPEIPSNAQEWSVADVNGDGRDDVFYACSNGGSPTYYLDYSTGSLVQTNLFSVDCTSPYPLHQALVGHFNADKYLDFVYLLRQTTEPHAFAIKTFLSDGSGGWVEGSTWPSYVDPAPSYYYNAQSYRVIDDDGDGIDRAVRTTDEVPGFDFDDDGIADRAFGATILFSSGGVGMLPVVLADDYPELFADVNGDGLTDVIVPAGSGTVTSLAVYLSTGRGFAEPIIRSGMNSSYYGMTAGDINGDGRAEIVLGQSGQSGTNGVAADVYYVTGSSIEAAGYSVYALGAYQTGRMPLGDFNGDGITDLVGYNNGRFLTSKGPVDSLMIRAFNGFGGEVGITYRGSSQWTNDRMASVEQTVTSLSVRDGRGWEAQTGYTYGDGAYDFAERRFLGFGTESAFLPCIEGESQCPTVTRAYSQNLASVGAVTDETYRNGSGTIIGETSRTFTSNNSTVPYTSLMTGETVYHYETPGSGETPDYLAVRKAYTYDAYANVTLEQDYGRDDVTGDERSIYTEFYPNTSDYIVSLPARSSTYDAETSAGTLIARITLYFDDASAYTTAPTVGDLTERQTQIDGSGTVASETFEYDSYGNRTGAEDPVSNRTEWTFDTTYHLYVVEEENDLSQSKTWTLNFPCGAPATETDLNGIVTAYSYDAFCRETLRNRSATGASVATEYWSFGTPSVQNVRSRRLHPSGGEDIYETRYFDGLGRVWREESGQIGNLPGCAEADYLRYAGGAWRCSSDAAYFDPSWTSVSLLLHMDGSDGSTTFTDSGPLSLSVAAGGNAQIDTSQARFGVASALLDGTNDTLALPGGQAPFVFGTADFTVEFWIRPNATGVQVVYDHRSPGESSNNRPIIQTDSSNRVIYATNGAVQITGTTTLSTGSWYHVAVTRSGTSTRLFVNGTQEGSTYSDSTNYGVGALNAPIFGTGGDGGADYNGWLDEVRVTKGIARYTSNFTAPTAAFLN